MIESVGKGKQKAPYAARWPQFSGVENEIATAACHCENFMSQRIVYLIDGVSIHQRELLFPSVLFTVGRMNCKIRLTAAYRQNSI